ncbi:glycosyltransferase family 4 protein [Hydrogenimonas sp. SS33]|uniref:glycosyltransferase family 4 protein n=1 Tax=Hydrogenimonas leucolamina TaxID=2954236 RepID=UPI00336BED89
MKLLFIPHVPNTRVVNRVYEFARVTGQTVLHWPMRNATLGEKIGSQAGSLFRGIGIEKGRLSMPMLLRPERTAARFNTALLNRVIERYRFDAVVNANALLFDVGSIRVPVIYDLVDDHLSVNPRLGLSASRVAKVEEDLRAAKAVICVSEALKKKASKFNASVRVVENGVDLQKFAQAKSLKKKWGWQGKRVFGFVGGVAPWTGLDRACEAYLRIADETTEMLVVGGDGGDYYRDLLRRYGGKIRFAGPVDPAEVGDYFRTIDVGLIPFELNDFTRNAYPIKALEYALAGAEVLSTPLDVLRAKKLPFVHFAPIEDFAERMEEMKKENRSPITYDFTPLSWEKQGERLTAFIEESLR